MTTRKSRKANAARKANGVSKANGARKPNALRARLALERSKRPDTAEAAENAKTIHPFRVGRARTGLGLFATQPIKKGKFIVEYLGRLLNNKQCEDIENKYLFEVNARWTIDGSSRKNLARYINHSCRGNSDVYINDHRIKIRAIKNIEPGQEITYDYGKDHFNAYIKPHGCKCDKCKAKRAKERAEVRAANARKKKRAERKLAQAVAR